MLKHVLLATLLFFQSHIVHAEYQAKILFHINDAFKLGHLKNSVKNVRDELGKDIKIQVIVNGKAVKSMLKSNAGNVKKVNKILQNKVDIA